VSEVLVTERFEGALGSDLITIGELWIGLMGGAASTVRFISSPAETKIIKRTIHAILFIIHNLPDLFYI
jgi:hypothetical protein